MFVWFILFVLLLILFGYFNEFPFVFFSFVCLCVCCHLSLVFVIFSYCLCVFVQQQINSTFVSVCVWLFEIYRVYILCLSFFFVSPQYFVTIRKKKVFSSFSLHEHTTQTSLIIEKGVFFVRPTDLPILMIIRSRPSVNRYYFSFYSRNILSILRHTHTHTQTG